MLFFQIDVHFWKQALKRRHVFGQKLHNGRQVGDHPHIALHSCIEARQLRPHGLDVADDLLRMTQHGLPGGRDRHATRMAFDQRQPDQ
ncbi:hypothetical protein D3C71_1804980 [compost metagenome]